MPFTRIEAERVSAPIVRQIERLVLRGILRPGERLPSERDMADRMGVSRPSLREAVAELEAKGLLVTRAGSGIFVADVLGAAFSPALIQLFSAHDEAVFDYVAFRRDMEGLAAERAARNGSDTDLEVISAVFAKMEIAHTKRSGDDEAALDAEFHTAIVEASHNVIMLHTMRAMYDLLRAGVFYNRQALFRQRTTRTALLAQHKDIHDAVITRNPAEARTAVERHMDYIQAALRHLRRVELNETVARQRLQHESER